MRTTLNIDEELIRTGPIGIIHSPFTTPVGTPIQSAAGGGVQATTDILDGTPLLDIKPYLEDADVHWNTRKGCLESKIEGMHGTQDDSRFVQEEAMR
jgi:tRNA (Thr-GGU) A37 N-methylase